MKKPELNKQISIPDLKIHHYERYLPTAFNDSLTLLEKVNKIIYYINQYTNITNEMIEKWNEVIEWIINNGLEEIINKRLDQWLEDGTLGTILENLLLNEYARKDWVYDTLETFKGEVTELLNEYKDDFDLLKDEVENLIDSTIKSINRIIEGSQVKGQSGIYQTLLMEPFTGQYESQIFDNSQHSPQGLAYINDNGVEKVFMQIRVSGDSWSNSERTRIIEYRLQEDGGVVGHETYSGLLQIGHQGLSAVIEDGEIFLFSGLTSGATPDSGKGYTKIRWRGSDTSQSDVTAYQVMGFNSSNHIMKDYYNATPCVSDDGRFVVFALTTTYVTGTRYCAVYDRKELESSFNPLNVYPLNLFRIEPAQQFGGHIVQDIACDGKYIYIYTGSNTHPSVNSIIIYTLSGVRLGWYNVEGSMAEYPISSLDYDVQLGTPRYFEAEGIAIRGHEILILTNDVWSKDGLYTRRTQKIHSISNEKKDNSTPINRGYMAIESPASFHLYGNAIDLTIPDEQALQFGFWNEQTKTIKNMLGYFNQNQLRLYDSRSDGYNSDYSSINTNRSSGRQFLELRSNVNVANGAGITMYGGKDEVLRGNIVLHALGLNNEQFSVRLQEHGTFRSATNGEQNLGSATYPWKNVYSSGGLIEPSDERLKDHIKPICDRVLDAWEEINYSQFKFKKSISEKGNEARIHFGVIAQEIKEVFEKHGLNAFDYGLLGYDEWTEEDEIIQVDEYGNEYIVQEKRESGTVYTIRASECLFLESALIRRELERIKVKNIDLD